MVIFNLIENIITSNKKASIESYHEMLKLGEEPIMILIMLANQFRIMYQAKKLYKKGYSGNDIATLLDIHPYRIKLALEKSNNYNEDQILKILYSLAQMDEDIKTGKKNKEKALELFLITL